VGRAQLQLTNGQAAAASTMRSSDESDSSDQEGSEWTEVTATETETDSETGGQVALEPEPESAGAEGGRSYRVIPTADDADFTPAPVVGAGNLQRGTDVEPARASTEQESSEQLALLHARSDEDEDEQQVCDDARRKSIAIRDAARSACEPVVAAGAVLTGGGAGWASVANGCRRTRRWQRWRPTSRMTRMAR
jgi:hypothetical protein